MVYYNIINGGVYPCYSAKKVALPWRRCLKRLSMYRRDTKSWLKHFDFMVLDLVVLQVAFALSYSIHHAWKNPYAEPLYANMSIFLMLCDLLIIFFTEPFRNVLKRGYYREMEALVQQAVFVELFAVLYLFVQKVGGDYSRVSMLLMGILYVLIGYITRIVWKRILQKARHIGNRSLLLVCEQKNVEKTIQNILDNNYGIYQINGLVLTDEGFVGTEIGGVPVVADLASASAYAQKNWVDEVFVNLLDGAQIPNRLIDDFVEMGVTVHLNLSQITHMPGRVQIVEKVGNYTVLTSSMNYATTKQAFVKRAMDIAGGLVGCLMCGVLFLFVAPAIYISSPGPVFFTQERIGKNGKHFKMYKFRSMYMDAEERKKELLAQNRHGGALMFKLDFDPRIIGNKILPDGTRKTGIGQFIRDTSIDEFPQFFNVLKGDMSLVGTRPPLISEFEAYQQHHRARMSVKPGITGMWQVSGRSEITDFEEVVRLDTKYINEWSIGLDIKILLQTVATVLKREGSM